MVSSNRLSLIKVKILNIHNGIFADFADTAPFMVSSEENLSGLVCFSFQFLPHFN